MCVLCCEAVSAAAREMERLGSAVVRMVLESLGVPERVAASPLPAVNRMVRLSFAAHYDYYLTNLVLQHDVEGLEVRARDGGRWVAVPPERGTCVVIAGEFLTVHISMQRQFKPPALTTQNVN